MHHRDRNTRIFVTGLMACLSGCGVTTQGAGSPLFDPSAPSNDMNPASSSPEDGTGQDSGGTQDTGLPASPTPSDNATMQPSDTADAGIDASGDAGNGTDPTADAGIADTPAAQDPAFTGQVICSTNSFWRDGDDGSPLMRPGYACNDCHRSEEEGPIYSIAGTLYRTGHELDDCNGVSGQAQAAVIEIVDSLGKVAQLTPNQAGNFFTTARFTFPVRTRVLSGGSERVMVGEITARDGDCNSCHTENGTQDAPGRIALP